MNSRYFPFPFFRRIILMVLLGGTAAVSAFAQQPGEGTPTYAGAFKELPITAVTPEGWLGEFLQRQRDGLSSHREISGAPFDSCLWAGVIPKTGWGRYEQAAYLVDGIYRCGLLTRDKPLTDLGNDNVKYVLEHPQPDGKLGPGPDEIGKSDDKDKGFQWPFAVFSRVLMAYYEATGDKALLEAMTKHYLSLPDDFGRSRRDADNIEGMCWLYGQTGDPKVLAMAERTWANFAHSPDSQWSLDKMKQEAPMQGHSPSLAVTTQQPALLYLYTGKKEYLDAVVGAYHAIARDHELLDGATTHDEETHGQAPEGGHDSGVTSDYAWAMGYIYEATGDASWGDKIERAVFNAGLGAIGKDFKSMQGYSAANQVIATQKGSVPDFAPAAERQGFRPGYAGQTFTGDVQRLLPNFAGRLWMSDGKGGLAATLYAPNTLRTTVGGSATPVTINEKTDYPFSGDIVFTITSATPVAFPLSLRIPGWAQGATVTVNGRPFAADAKPGTFLKIEGTFASGTVIKLSLPMTVRKETAGNGGIGLLRGPLLFALKIKTDAKPVTAGISDPAFPAWDLHADSPWNYALDVADLGKIKVDAKEPAAFPWTPDSTPLTLTVPARKVPSWEIGADGKNPPFPDAAAPLSPESEQVELIPMGATQLRVAIFPVVK